MEGFQKAITTNDGKVLSCKHVDECPMFAKYTELTIPCANQRELRYAVHLYYCTCAISCKFKIMQYAGAIARIAIFLEDQTLLSTLIDCICETLDAVFALGYEKNLAENKVLVESLENIPVILYTEYIFPCLNYPTLYVFSEAVVSLRQITYIYMEKKFKSTFPELVDFPFSRILFLFKHYDAKNETKTRFFTCDNLYGGMNVRDAIVATARAQFLK